MLAFLNKGCTGVERLAAFAGSCLPRSYSDCHSVLGDTSHLRKALTKTIMS